jgi:D-beta-D-heptose 7-phosphate kinase/D-beta-D-heptose 1-phosphate adenosyltransferase
MTPTRIQQLIQSFATKRILVVGDLMLDEFVWGNVSRISPEAPVPVVDVERTSYFPGGAANVARNLREFTPGVHIMALIGTDAHGQHLDRLLGEGGIALDCLQRDAAYPTIVKTRIIARNQQVVRVDREKKTGLSHLQAGETIARFEKMLPEIDAVIFEDYGKGLLGQKLVDRMLDLAKSAGKIVTVDPNPNNQLAWHSITCATPNRTEAFACVGRKRTEPLDLPLDDVPLIEVGRELLEKWSASMMLVTLGEHGMMLFRRDEEPFHIPTRAQDVFDVSGAGDTCIALFTLALAAGADPVEAAHISNHASGVVVGKLGTATLTPEELMASFSM